MNRLYFENTGVAFKIFIDKENNPDLDAFDRGALHAAKMIKEYFEVDKSFNKEFEFVKPHCDGK